MSVTIPESHTNLLTEAVFVTFTTLFSDGHPQSSVVWADYDGMHVLINTARGRQKDKNVQGDPRVTVLAIDPENPYRYLEVRGTVEAFEEDGAVEHIDKLAKLYVGADSYFGGVAPAEQADKETRVILKIKPTKVNAFGS